MEQSILDCVFIGNDSLLIECGDIWRARGHRITAIVTDAARVASWGRKHGIEVLEASGDYATALSQRSFHHLFAITYLKPIPGAVLALPQRTAINFHDGPLPHYAGLNAPAWALIHREKHYGISWHVMSERLDGGDVLKQLSFEINADETALSLNTRCFGYAIESFGSLVDELAAGQERRSPQLAQGSYFGRYARPPAAALLDFRAPAVELAALVRALDFGPRYPNSLGAATILCGGRAFVVTSAEAALDEPSGPTGTLMAAGADSVSVACGEGTLIIRGLREACGAPVAMQDALQQLGCALGCQLESLTESARAALTELDAKLARAEPFWVDRLAEVEPTHPPYLDGPHAPLTAGTAAVETLPLAVPEAFRARFGSNAAIAAAFASYLGRVSGNARVWLALRDARTRSEQPELQPLLAACLPLPIEIEPAPCFDDVVERFSQAVQQAHAHGGFLRHVMVRYPALASSGCLRAPGLLPVGVVLDDEVSELTAGTLVQLHVNAGAACLRFASAQLHPEAAARVQRELAAYMHNLAQAADKPVQEVDLLSPEAQRRLLADWNPAPRAQAELACVHRQIEAQVDRTPDAVALVCGDRRLSFRQLDQAANRVARHLRELGVDVDQPVGVYVERSLELVVAALGVMKAGGAYVPLDPAYPEDRIAFMLEDAKLGVVVTQAALAARLPSVGAPLRTVEVDSCVASHVDERPASTSTDDTSAGRARPESSVGPQHLAYLIYTSGSTGKPKGVMVEHRQVANFFAGMDERVSHQPSTGTATGPVFLAVTSLSFDISVLELWWSLSRGFKVVVHRDAARTRSSTRTPASARPVDFSLFYFSADAHASGSARYRLLMEGAKFADEHGFAAVWTPERHFHAFGGLYPNPAVTGAALAAITRRVGIRAGSVVLPLHHPARVAEQWAVVDNISNGRVGISIASGWQPDDFVFAPDNYKDAKRVMMHNLDIVRRLWRGESVEFDGPLSKVSVRTLPEPVQKDLPVWITTAGNVETFELAGTAGANLLTHLLGQSLEKLAPKIAAYRRARGAAGFDPGSGIVSLMLHTFVGADRAQVKAAVRQPLKAYLATSMDLIKDKAWVFPTFQRPQGQSAQALDGDLTSLSDTDRDALLEAAFERYFEHSGLFGSVDDALGMVERVKAIGVDDVACLIDFGAPTDLVLEHLPYIQAVKARELQLREAAPEHPGARRQAEGGGDEHAFSREIRAHAVTHLQCTPSMARMLLDHAQSGAALGRLQHVLLGGEALSHDLLADLRKHTQATITNMYGPTETTVWSSTYRAEPADSSGGRAGSVPIGTPIVNTRFYVTDKQRRLLPAGVPGELWIGGHGVTRGYWERSELTAERFVSDPFASDSDAPAPCVPTDAAERPARMYHTGDRAVWRPDGVMQFLGRSDHQVKLRGYRIELGEIEARARAVAGVKDAVVIVREDRPGDQRLVGYLVAKAEPALDLESVRQQLRATLPEFMVPALFVELGELPLTPNRKVDRKALPAPQLPAAGPAGAPSQQQTPQSDLDKAIASVWRDVLGRDLVGLDDNFFDLGGHSLLVVRAHRLLQEALSRTLALTDLYRFPTIRKFSMFLSHAAADSQTDTQKAGARGAKRREAMRRRSG